MQGNIFIVGGSRGIGRAVAETFASRETSILFTYASNEDDALGLVEDLNKKEVKRVEPFCIDAGHEDAMAAYQSVLDQYGPIDVLVNCAGITRDRTLSKMTFEEWDHVIQTNLYSVFYSCRTILPAMMDRGYGRIINISSVIGQTGNFGQSNYAASKAAIVGFTKSIARECAKHDITANAVCPGFIDTRMTQDIPEELREKLCARIPKGRFGTPQDVADIVWHLARPESGYITGQQFNVNGGLCM